MGQAAGILAGVSGGLNIVGGYSDAQALKVEGDYIGDLGKVNAGYSRMQADDAIRRGDSAAMDVSEYAAKVKSSQRVALASQGIDPDSGVGLALQEDTANKAARDIMTVKNNAWREAWGYRKQAADYEAQGAIGKLASRLKARRTIMNAGAQAAGQFGQAASYMSGGKGGGTTSSSNSSNASPPGGTILERA